MSAAIALGGWVLAAAAALGAVLALRLLAVRMEAVARACHELRGPLTAARLGLELGVRCGQLSPARLRAIDLELERAALALNDLTAVGQPRPSPDLHREVVVEELLADLVEAWRGSAARRGVELRLRWRGGPIRVWGERLRLAQAVGNLIVNAIEHGGRTVEVGGRAENASVRIEVSDDGPGLEVPVSEHVRRRRHGRSGHGRGLAIASAVAEGHGGRLAAAPSERGARLVLELPAASQHSHEADRM